MHVKKRVFKIIEAELCKMAWKLCPWSYISRLKRVLSNKTKNELPKKITRASLPVQESTWNAICFFCDSAGVFSKHDFVSVQLRVLHYISIFANGGYKTVSQNSENNFSNFPTIQKIMFKNVLKLFELPNQINIIYWRFSAK